MTRTVDDLAGGAFEVPSNPPIPATPCRICKSAVTGRAICEDCLYGPREEEHEVDDLF